MYPSFQPLILIYRRRSFMYPHWGCTSIYPPLFYPFRSLPMFFWPIVGGIYTKSFKSLSHSANVRLYEQTYRCVQFKGILTINFNTCNLQIKWHNEYNTIAPLRRNISLLYIISITLINAGIIT